jgi:hypothetical protein
VKDPDVGSTEIVQHSADHDSGLKVPSATNCKQPTQHCRSLGARPLSDTFTVVFLAHHDLTMLVALTCTGPQRGQRERD